MGYYLDEHITYKEHDRIPNELSKTKVSQEVQLDAFTMGHLC